MPSGGSDTGRVLVAGEALIDRVVRPSGSVHEAAGGGPFNTARTISRLGGRASFCGAISTDERGQLLFGALVDDGVDVARTRRTALPTTLATAFLDSDGAATYEFQLDGTSATDYPPDERPSLDGFAALHVGTLGLVIEPLATTCRNMVADAGDDVLVVVDPNCRPLIIPDRDVYRHDLRPVLERADVVKVSTDDLRYLWPDRDTVAAAADLLHSGPAAVLVTRGAEGTTIVTPMGTVEIAAVPVAVVDTIGAGDSFGGAFTQWWVEHGLGRGQLGDLDLLAGAVQAATAVAAVTCSRQGADPPHRGEVPDFTSSARRDASRVLDP